HSRFGKQAQGHFRLVFLVGLNAAAGESGGKNKMGNKEYKCDECGRVIYFNGICNECRRRHKREAYRSMTDAEAESKVAEITAALGALDDKFYNTTEYDDFLGLLAYKGISTASVAEAAAEAEVYYPHEIYRDAAPGVREKLIALVMQPDCKEANHILQCLAIAGGDDVLAAFVHLERNPLPWSKNLFVPPSVYAQAGGWTFDSEGRRAELNFDRCYPVFPIAGGAAETDKAVTVATPRTDVCPQCGTKLMDILTLDGRDERLAFLNLPGTMRIPACPQCAAMCERTLVRYSPDGAGTMELMEPFGDESAMPESEYAEMTSGNFALAERPENLFFARGSYESIITVGGFAAWIQDFQYDACPDCGKPMRYFASVPWYALSDWAEGTLFLEICLDCRVISAFHQQT
ncbi:MAG: hypothetical protein LBK66_02260, partial [Spirochaetaceae bacterium]|nr:hypothetical protein [Spirochaetaceae bacterium]